jgi:hypothetical protein
MCQCDAARPPFMLHAKVLIIIISAKQDLLFHPFSHVRLTWPVLLTGMLRAIFVIMHISMRSPSPELKNGCGHAVANMLQGLALQAGKVSRPEPRAQASRCSPVNVPDVPQHTVSTIDVVS